MKIRCSEDEILQELNIRDERLRIDSINKKHNACSIFQSRYIDIPFVFKNGNIPINMVMIMLSTMPIFVVKKAQNSYACVGNLRVLQLARMILPKSHRILVKIMNENERVIRHMALVELIIMPMLCEKKLTKEIIMEYMVIYNDDEIKNKYIKGLNGNIVSYPKGNKRIISAREIQYTSNNINRMRYSGSSPLTKNCIRLIIEMYPIFVTEQSGKSYKCCANRKTLEMAKETMGNSVDIPVIKTKYIDDNIIEKYEIHIVKLQMFIYAICVGGAPQIGKVARVLSKEDKAFLFTGSATQENISSQVGYSRRYMYHTQTRLSAVWGIGTKTEDMSKYGMDIRNEEVMK